MKRLLVNLMCAFIPVKAKRDAVRNKFFPKKRVKFPDPWELMLAENHIEIAEEDKAHVSLSVHGKGNTIIVKKLCQGISGMINISLAGNNCKIVLDEGIWVSGVLNIIAGQVHQNFGLIDNTLISIGKYTTFENCNIITYNSNAVLEIGERCMFSCNIHLYNTDGHPIYNMDGTKLLNKARTMKIGNHVWIGGYATLLKNVQIADNCIVGWGSVATGGCFDICNSIIAGNPAKYVKHGITWEKDGSGEFTFNDN